MLDDAQEITEITLENTTLGAVFVAVPYELPPGRHTWTLVKPIRVADNERAVVRVEPDGTAAVQYWERVKAK